MEDTTYQFYKKRFTRKKLVQLWLTISLSVLAIVLFLGLPQLVNAGLVFFALCVALGLTVAVTRKIPYLVTLKGEWIDCKWFGENPVDYQDVKELYLDEDGCIVINAKGRSLRLCSQHPAEAKEFIENSKIRLKCKLEKGDVEALIKRSALSKRMDTVQPEISILISVFLTSIFAIQYLGPFYADPAKLTAYGANLNELTFGHLQLHRLIASVFIHANALHFLMNLAVFVPFAVLLERLVGKLRFVLVLMVSSLSGAVATGIYDYDMPAAGFSGAIYGIFGGLAVTTWRFGESVPSKFRLHYVILILLVLYNIQIPVLNPLENVDVVTHFFGFIGGLTILFITYLRSDSFTFTRTESGAALQKGRMLAVAFILLGLGSIVLASVNQEQDEILVRELAASGEHFHANYNNSLAWSVAISCGAGGGDLDKARIIAERAVSLGGRPYIYDTLALIYYRLGDIESAVANQIRAFELAGDEAYLTPLHFYLTRLSGGSYYLFSDGGLLKALHKDFPQDGLFYNSVCGADIYEAVPKQLKVARVTSGSSLHGKWVNNLGGESEVRGGKATGARVLSLRGSCENSSGQLVINVVGGEVPHLGHCK